MNKSGNGKKENVLVLEWLGNGLGWEAAMQGGDTACRGCWRGAEGWGQLLEDSPHLQGHRVPPLCWSH